MGDLGFGGLRKAQNKDASTQTSSVLDSIAGNMGMSALKK